MSNRECTQWLQCTLVNAIGECVCSKSYSDSIKVPESQCQVTAHYNVVSDYNSHLLRIPTTHIILESTARKIWRQKLFSLRLFFRVRRIFSHYFLSHLFQFYLLRHTIIQLSRIAPFSVCSYDAHTSNMLIWAAALYHELFSRCLKAIGSETNYMKIFTSSSSV